jgi:hypothetical protein
VVEALAAVLEASTTVDLVYSVLELRVVDPALQALTVLVFHLVKIVFIMEGAAAEFCRDQAVLAVVIMVLVVDQVAAAVVQVAMLAVLADQEQVVVLQEFSLGAVVAAVGGPVVEHVPVRVLAALLAALAVKQLTLMDIASLGQAVIQQEFMGVFHDIFG